MRKLAIVAAVLMLGGTAWAQAPILTGEAEAHVWVDVVANIAVGVSTPNVNIGQIALGEFDANVTFRIDANVEQVKIKIIATDLYKGDAPASPWIIPVKVGESGDGALVQPAIGNAVGGHGNLLAWLLAVTYPNGMAAHETEQWAFESGQSGHFSQYVNVTVTYDQANPELPKGQYSGFIKLVAEIDP